MEHQEAWFVQKKKTSRSMMVNLTYTVYTRRHATVASKMKRTILYLKHLVLAFFSSLVVYIHYHREHIILLSVVMKANKIE